MFRWRKSVVAIAFVGLAGVMAPSLFGQWGRRAAPYDGAFTFVRLRWKSGTDGFQRVRGPNNFWFHEFPGAERNLMRALKDITLVNAKADGSLVLTLDDPNLFKYPIAVLWEPGYLVMTDEEAALVGRYLLKGGFLIINDFELEQWENFELQTERIVPGSHWVRLDASHPIFQTFFAIERPDIPHAAYHHLVGLTPEYYGLFEDNDQKKRLMAIANYNTNLAEYWQVADAGFFPIAAANNAFKLGINYMLYGMTH